MKKMLYLLVLPVIFLLSGCGNALSGKWGNGVAEESFIEFTGDKQIVVNKAMGMESKKEIPIKEYKVEKNRVGTVISDPATHEEATLWYDIVDANTVKLSSMFGTTVLHRIK